MRPSSATSSSHCSPNVAVVGHPHEEDGVAVGLGQDVLRDGGRVGGRVAFGVVDPVDPVRGRRATGRRARRGRRASPASRPGRAGPGSTPRRRRAGPAPPPRSATSTGLGALVVVDPHDAEHGQRQVHAPRHAAGRRAGAAGRGPRRPPAARAGRPRRRSGSGTWRSWRSRPPRRSPASRRRPASSQRTVGRRAQVEDHLVAWPTAPRTARPARGPAPPRRTGWPR